jgi:hypothetical protein
MLSCFNTPKQFKQHTMLSTSFQRYTGLQLPENETNFARRCSNLVSQREAMHGKINSTRQALVIPHEQQGKSKISSKPNSAPPLQREDHEVITLSHNAWIDKLDSVLCYPEQFKYRGMRYLVHAAKHTEELGESIADLSGMVERLVKNVLSRGKTANTAQVFAAGVGRTTTMFLTTPGFAVHKALGAALYAASCGFSVVALLAATTPLGKKRDIHAQMKALKLPPLPTPEAEKNESAPLLGSTKHPNNAPPTTGTIKTSLKNARFAHSMVNDTSRLLLAGKEKTMSMLHRQAQGSNTTGASIMRSMAKRLSRKLGEYGPEAYHLHKYDSSYIWGHLHQYGRVTRTLMSSAHLFYTVVNRLGASFDKYVGSALGKMVYKPVIGRILGHRVGMMISTALATYISMLLAPFIVGISATGAMACGLTLLLMQAATLSARLEGWKGDIEKPIPFPRKSSF